jgi:multicomponent K+:H+ antiporter subunit E
MMKRVLPFPVLWLLLTAMWLLLNETLALGHWLLGAVVAVGATHSLRLLQEPGHTLRRPRVVAQLAWIVLVDIVRSNIGVAWIVLHARSYGRSSQFLDIPLELRNPYGLAVLACIITSNPGTVWSRYDSSRGILTMHILDLIDEQEWRRIIKDRYERRLLEIFQ